MKAPETDLEVRRALEAPASRDAGIDHGNEPASRVEKKRLLTRNEFLSLCAVGSVMTAFEVVNAFSAKKVENPEFDFDYRKKPFSKILEDPKFHEGWFVETKFKPDENEHYHDKRDLRDDVLFASTFEKCDPNRIYDRLFLGYYDANHHVKCFFQSCKSNEKYGEVDAKIDYCDSVIVRGRVAGGWVLENNSTGMILHGHSIKVVLPGGEETEFYNLTDALGMQLWH